MTTPGVRLADLHPPLREVVAAELRRLILSGEIAPGSRLIEDRLAERLGVSRNPVREAIGVLASEGFVESIPRRGACVARLSVSAGEDLFDVRMALEPVGARLAARRGDPTGLEALEHVLEQARAATDAGALDVLADLNSAFHAGVIKLGANDYLSAIAEPMIKRAQWLFRPGAATRAPHSWVEHRELLEAIRSGDEEGAEAEARRHVAAARRSFRALAAQLPDLAV
ncbi:MAG: GntR family transcriptional regulator [Acidimicrobiales bacterium]